MPQLLDEQLETVNLPNIDNRPELNDAWVVMDVSPMRANDTEAMDEHFTTGKAGLEMLVPRIREWNFTNSQGEMEQINRITVGRLHVDHYNYLVQKIQSISGELTVDEKKDLSPTSTQSIQEVTQEG